MGSRITDTTRPGPTGRVLEQATVWTDGTVRWGMALDGSDHHGVYLLIRPLVEHGKRKWRMGAHHKTECPLWWGQKHKDALDLAIREKLWNLQIAARSKTASIVEGSDFEMPGGGEIQG